MINWTPQQEEAISARDTNLLVSAAAGSGKTAVLVERIIRTVIDEKTDIDCLLVVTFTNAAASGMKDKIQSEMIDRISQDKDNRVFLKKQLNLLGRSYISTIHSFCFNVIRKYFHLIDIDPDFKIMDLNEVQLLLEEVITGVLEQEYGSMNTAFKSFVDEYAENRGDDKIINIIKETYHYILSYPDPIGWLASSIDKLKNDAEEINHSIWMELLSNEAKRYVDFARRQIEQAIENCPEEMSYYTTLQSDWMNVNELIKGLEQGHEAFVSKLIHLEHQKLNAIKKKDKEEYGVEIAEQIKLLRAQYKDSLGKLKNFYPLKDITELALDMNRAYVPMSALLDVVTKVHEELLMRKKAKKSLDFSDAEHLALEILSKDDAIKYYKEKFKYIYIDEYQDSNAVQEEIISRVSRGNNLFMVGDVKQSIYRFRQADPTLFIAKYYDYKTSDINKLILLNQNYRSRGEILDFVNYIFNHLMKEELGEINYDDDASLKKGLEFQKKEDSVEINIIDKKIDQDLDEEMDEDLLELKTNEIEARYIAKKIKQIIHEDYFDQKFNAYRKIQYRDIVILLRSAVNWANTFEDVFYEAGIPFYSDITGSYLETIEIKIMTNLLRLIDNMRQDIPLMSVMRSAIGKFSIDEMLKIKTETGHKLYYESLMSYVENFQDELAEKIKYFITRIEEWRLRTRNTSLSKLIWEILVETDYYYFNGALPNGNIRQGNLRLLSDRAFDFENEGFKSISDFLYYLERVKKASGDFSTAKLLGENDDVVRLMTVHKSKGLEFPVVICAGLKKKFNQTDLRKDIILNKICGVAPKFVDVSQRIYKETMPRYASRIQIARENTAEEMRVLYVAMTRAIDRLILVGTVNDFDKWLESMSREEVNYYNIFTKASFLDWIGLVLAKENCHHSLNRIIINELGEAKTDLAKARRAIESIKATIHSDEELNAFKINQKFNFNYPYLESSIIPDKITVTEMKELKHDSAKSIRYKMPGLREIPIFKSKSATFTAAEIGTIMHTVLQIIELQPDMSKEYIEKSISSMIEKKHLTLEEAETININHIYNFYHSSLGLRLLKAEAIKREQPFILKKIISLKLENKLINSSKEVLLQGIIDCYFYENDEIVLIDYKTDKVPDDKIKMLTDYYSPQILEYREALEKLTGHRVKESYLYLLSLSKAIQIK